MALRLPKSQGLGSSPDRGKHRRVHLPQLPPRHPPDLLAARSARLKRLRLAVLVGVHLLIAVHLIHWLVAGRTVNRFVLSDAMDTLESGRLNPGFLLFSAAAIVALLAGRWLCGWACHMGALQEACAWLLRRCGVRPRMVRVRLLGFVPIGLAAYMFVWPTFRRDVLGPLVSVFSPETGRRVSGAAFPGWSTDLVSDDLWRGLPGVWVAIPFLLVCGGATVYFLGSRGFCRYGCPYGGVFAPLEKLAPLRIKVDLNSCDGCGKCTAACSSGVRVREEVRAYGRVVSSQCVKTLDCITACPRDALSFGLAGPAVFKRQVGDTPSKPRWDMPLRGELALLALFFVTLFVVRGLYGLIPLLMAVGVSLCVTALGFGMWQTWSRRDARLAGAQVRQAGRLRPAGFAFSALACIAVVFLVQSAAVRLMQWRGGVHDDAVRVPRTAVFTNDPPSLGHADLEAAERALRWYGMADSWRRGGIGLAGTPAVRVRAAWLRLVIGDLEQAEEILSDLARVSGIDSLHAELARVVLLRGEAARAESTLEASLSRDPGFAQCRDLLARLRAGAGRVDEGGDLYRRRLSERPDDLVCRAGYGAFLLASGDLTAAREQLTLVVETEPRMVGAAMDLATAWAAGGSRAEAARVLDSAIESQPAATGALAAHAQRLGLAKQRKDLP
jgi:tetratricopeptide (TPR) repeat protein/ferredoxin